MELRHLKTFVSVAGMLSFHRAAESLHYAQSTISAQIHALEEELGVPLFDRLGRRILLTEAGERLLGYARKMLDLEEEAQAQVVKDGEAQGSLTIRVPESLCVHRLPPAIRAFRGLMPKVRLQFITCAHEGLYQDLRKGVTDLAFLLAESVQGADLQAEILGTERLVLIAPPKHPLAGKPSVRTVDLEGETLLLSRVDCSYRRLFERIMAEEGVRPGITLEFNSVQAITRCVAAGLGITVIPEIAVWEKCGDGDPVVLPWTENELEVAILMIHHRDKWVSPALRAFMDAVRENLDTR